MLIMFCKFIQVNKMQAHQRKYFYVIIFWDIELHCIIGESKEIFMHLSGLALSRFYPQKSFAWLFSFTAKGGYFQWSSDNLSFSLLTKTFFFRIFFNYVSQTFIIQLYILVSLIEFILVPLKLALLEG